jgi:hypothetical protein
MARERLTTVNSRFGRKGHGNVQLHCPERWGYYRSDQGN